ncbi:MAG TPA: NUDIX hydrolase [Planctomycetaceae bacterium]
MREHGPWKIVRSHEVYRDPWLVLVRDDVIRPDGEPGSYIVAHLKPGVSVLAMAEDGDVYLTEEFHYGVGRVTIEAVSGGVEPGEDVLETAKRELREEAGLEATEWTDLGVVDPFTANVVSPTRLYLARGLSHVGQDLEGTERIRTRKVPLAEAVRMTMESEITHGPSCVLILKAASSLSLSR